MTEELRSEGTEVGTDDDRYPSATKALQRIRDEGELPDGPIEYLDVTVMANGEISYRIREPRGEELYIGFLPEPQSG